MVISAMIMMLAGLFSACNHESSDNKDNTDNIVDTNLSTENKDGQCHFGHFIQDACVTDIDDGQYRLSAYDELDGSERKCMVSFDGSVQNNTTFNDTAMINGKLYFGGEISKKAKDSEDDEGTPIFDDEYRSAIFCIDLENYTLYKVSNTNECDIIFQCDEPIILSGIIDNTLFYRYKDEEGSNNNVYKREIGSDSEEVIIDNSFHAVVIDGKIYVMEAGWTESSTKYSVYDKEGSLLENFEYNGYVYLCADVADRIVYYTITAVGVVDKEDIKDILTKGQELGAPV